MVSNGYVPASNLVTVQGAMQLETSTAAGWNVVKAAAAAQGVSLTIAAPAGAYRSYFVQQDMIDHPQNYNLNPESTVGLAAAGHSTHGFGTRVDIGSTAGNNWMISHGGAYGFVREFGLDDPNHYAYLGGSIAPISSTGRQGSKDMELYCANPPATIPAKYLALNAGLIPGHPIYELIPSVGIPRVTQDQTLVGLWAQSIFGQAGNTAVIQISWGWFDQLFDQQYAIAHSLGAS